MKKMCFLCSVYSLVNFRLSKKKNSNSLGNKILYIKLGVLCISCSPGGLEENEGKIQFLLS